MSQALKDFSIFIRTNLWLVPVIAALLGAVFYYVAPPPPMQITISTGYPTAGYETFAKKLKVELAKQGFELEVINSTGSHENARLLLDPDSDVTIALLQSGHEQALSEDERARLFSLGAMYQEPLWLFLRKGVTINTLADLDNYRVAIGGDDSGSRLIVLPLLQANGLDIDNLGDNWRDYSGTQAAQELLDNELDAVFFVVPPENEFIQTFASHPDVELFHFERAATYERHFPFIKGLTINQGLLSIAKNMPQTDSTTLSSKALLVVNESFHPALTPLILAAAKEAMKQGTLLDQPDSWPVEDQNAFPMLDEAIYFYDKGLPLLQRYLPFRIASLADRYIILLFPLLVVLFPLFKVAGPIYRWRIRSRIYRWYKSLRDIDKKLLKNTPPEHLEADVERLLSMQKELAKVEVPLAFTHELYELHLHVRFVLQRIKQLQSSSDTESKNVEPIL